MVMAIVTCEAWPVSYVHGICSQVEVDVRWFQVSFENTFEVKVLFISALFDIRSVSPSKPELVAMYML